MGTNLEARIKMGLTITEKILLSHTNKKKIEPGEFIEARVDLALGNDITAPIAIKQFKAFKLEKVFNRNKIALVPDHFTPSKDQKAAAQCRIMKDFADQHRIKNYFEVGRAGIEHALLPEKGLVLPGDLVIGADSHTCTYGALGAFSTGVGSTDLAYVISRGKLWFKVPETIKFVYRGKLQKWVGGKDLILYTIGQIGVDGALYKAMEFSGKVIENLPMDDRFSMSNMAIEAGGKSGIIEPDKTTREYIDGRIKENRIKRKPIYYKSDKDARFCAVKEFKVSDLEPQVACPHKPDNVKQVRKVKNVKLDQVVIGSCTNGRISDLEEAALILKNKKVNKKVKLIVIPATQDIYLQAVNRGLANIFVEAGGIFSPPTCGPCLGAHMGILDKGEVALATTNRNFAGRMGHPKSKVYLSNPAVAAASAVAGKIVHPEKVL
jgi:3-isopropylmalate/(R)-2-methylmalate dehydratase large subunit